MFIRRIDVEGEFDMLWKDVEEKKLIKKSPEEVAAVIKVAIDKINAGSVENIDTLLRKAL